MLDYPADDGIFSIRDPFGVLVRLLTTGNYFATLR